MTIFSEFGFRGRLPVVNANLLNANAFALEQLVSIQSVTSDLRGALFELAWRVNELRKDNSSPPSGTEKAAAAIGEKAHAVQLDVTDQASVTAAARTMSSAQPQRTGIARTTCHKSRYAVFAA